MNQVLAAIRSDIQSRLIGHHQATETPYINNPNCFDIIQLGPNKPRIATITLHDTTLTASYPTTSIHLDINCPQSLDQLDDFLRACGVWLKREVA